MPEGAMFADSLLETSRNQRSRRGLTTLTSFGVEAGVIGLLLLLPLWKTVGLPHARTVSTPISVGRPDPEPAPTRRSGSTTAAATTATPVNARFVAPGHIPSTTYTGPVDPVPQPTSCGTCMPGLANADAGTEGLSALLAGYRPVPVRAQPPTVTRAFRTSTILEGSLIRRVQPVYPPLAKSVRVQGPVVLQAVISKAGTIENLQVLSGHPMLAKAALEAVSQWRYRPYILNSEPIEVETQITVNFILASD